MTDPAQSGGPPTDAGSAPAGATDTSPPPTDTQPVEDTTHTTDTTDTTAGATDADGAGDTPTAADTTTDDTAVSVARDVLQQDDTIFENPDLLKVGHIPRADRIVGRDAQIKSLATELRPAVHGRTPENVIIYGKTGTGKSLGAQHVLEIVEDMASDAVSVGTVRIDCGEDTTETQVVVELAKTLATDEIDISIPESGLSTSKYYKKLWTILDACYDVVIVVLDEVDLLESENTLRSLSRIEEDQKADCCMGIVAISNKLHFPDTLTERTESTLQYNELVFDPYDAGQLREILEKRTAAFHDDVLMDGVIPLCAAYAAREHGDARRAIDILRHAGRCAEQAEDTTVTERHVRQAREEAEKDRFREFVGEAPIHVKALLYALADLTMADPDEELFSTRAIYTRYGELLSSAGHDPVSERRVRDLLSEQAFLGVTANRKNNQGRAGGVNRWHRLIEEPELVKEIFHEDDDFAAALL